MKVSVALCTFNGERFLAEQLQSIKNQTVQPFEVVVCDDGSTDCTMNILDEFAATAEFSVHVFRNSETLYFTGNFLRAASLCHGDYIAFCDQDDIWETNKIECLVYNLLKNPEIDLIVHSALAFSDHGGTISRRIPDLLGLTPDSCVAPFDAVCKGFAMTISRYALTESLQYWDWAAYKKFTSCYGAPIGHDLFLFAVCFRRRTIIFIDECLVAYRIHDHNVTATRAALIRGPRRILFLLHGLTGSSASYRTPAKKWAVEASFLRAYLSRLPGTPWRGIVALAESLQYRSECWMLRSEVYNRAIPRRLRIRSFFSLLKAKAYTLPGNRSTGFGYLSSVKDLFFCILI